MGGASSDWTEDDANGNSVVDATGGALYAPDFSPVPMKNVTLPCGKIVQEPVWDKPCCVVSLSLKCGHGARGFVLKPPTTRTNAMCEQVIQVLGDKDDHDTVTLTFAGGPCTKGFASTLPVVTLDQQRFPHTVTTRVEAPKPPAGPLYLYDFMTVVLGNNPLKSAIVYSGGVDCCEGGQEFAFRIEAFPYRKWNGKITIGWKLGNTSQLVDYMDYSNPDNPVKKQAKLYSIEDRGTFEISGKIQVVFGDRKTDVQLPTFEKSGATSRPEGQMVFAGTKNFFEKVLPKVHTLCSSPLVTIKPLWPELSLSGGIETVEVKGKYNVARKGTISFEADPLFGLSGSMDLLSWLIMGGATALGAPNIGLQLAKLKQKAEEGFGSGRVGGKVVAKIEFTASGKIGGALEWEFPEAGKYGGSGSIKADLDFELKGELSAEVRFFRVSYTAGASISGKTGVGGEIKYAFHGEEPGFSGSVKFKGLILEAVFVHSVGGSTVGTQPNGLAKKKEREEQDEGRWEKNTTRQSDSNTAWHLEVIGPAEWPKSDKAVLTDGSSP